MHVKKAYQLEKSDFVHFGFYAVRKSVVLELLFIAAVAVIASAVLADGKYFIFGSLLGFGATACVIVPIIYITAYFRTVKNYEKYVRDFAMIETTIDKKGFTQQSVLGKRNVPFNKLFKVCESKYGFYVYISSGQAVILSKNHFTDKEINDMRMMFKKYVDKGRLRLRDK